MAWQPIPNPPLSDKLFEGVLLEIKQGKLEGLNCVLKKYLLTEYQLKKLTDDYFKR